VSLDFPLPEEIEVGGGTALFLAGTAFCPEAPVRDLALLVDGDAQPLSAWGMPRLDFFAGLHPRLDPYAAAGARSDPMAPLDPELRAYTSGFWGLARVPARNADGVCSLSLRARLAAGGERVAELGSVRVLARPAPVVARPAVSASSARPLPASVDGRALPRIAICMATFNPPPDLLAAQIESIRDQTVTDWACYVSDDGSSAETLAHLQALVGADSRFILSRSPRRLGFYRNFERALRMVSPETELIALADQDDRWERDKLQALTDALGEATLVYSDARIVARDGSPVAGTYWATRRNNHADMTSLLVANAVTGAASLMRREVLDHALPFPPAQFHHYHDHWLGLTALALGEIAYVQRPLYDYVQHGDASLGHAAATRMTALSRRLAYQRAPRERIRLWRLHYFVDVCRLQQFAAILLLRCEDRMAPRKRRALRRFLAADGSLLPVARLAARGLRELVGRPETLGAEWMLAWALIWRRLLAASARPLPQRRLRLDAVPPPTLAMAPERTGLEGPVREVADKIAPLEVAIDDGAPPRVNLLIPTIDVAHFFGGYISKFNLALALARRGVRVRIVTVDPTGALPPAWRCTLEAFSGLSGLFEQVEFAFGRGSSPLVVSGEDRFIATTWWTAHIAAALGARLQRRRFLYLIQEYEPFTFPMGTYAALAAGSYEFEHDALFSSELLREYFQRHRLGVFADGDAVGSAASRSFQNAITAVPAPTVPELAARRPRRLLFYARPEAHAARNMFELGVLALSRLAQDGALAGWELHGIGSIGGARTLPLGGGASLALLPRSDQDAYAAMLRSHDVGLALMYTPHPSLVPLEMASAGMLTVTSRFENKTPEAMAAISANLITAAPTVEGVVGGLRAALAGAEDVERRVGGSAVAWSRDWAQTFDDGLLDQVCGWLGAAARR
jgi:glycosyltransferase involved in cell wall biosynthesis